MDHYESFAERLKRAIHLDFPQAHRPEPILPGAPEFPEASVLMLFDSSLDPRLLLTRRSETVKTHQGQIALPGGMVHSDDLDVVHTALRETEEEVGILRSQLEVLGILPSIVTATRIHVTPVLAVSPRKHDELEIRACPREIADVFWVSLAELLNPDNYHDETLQFGSHRYTTPVYQVGEQKIWGATAGMIKNLLDRLHALE